MAAYHKLSKLGPELRARIWEKTNGICWYCSTQTNPWRDFCIDHVENHGSNNDENLVPCCRKCNTAKRDKNVEKFREKFKEKFKHDFWAEEDGQIPTWEHIETSKMYSDLTKYLDDNFDNIRWGAPYKNDLIMLTLFFLAYNPAEAVPALDIQVLASQTHQSKTLILSHIFRLIQDNILHLQFLNKCIVYSLEIDTCMADVRREAFYLKYREKLKISNKHPYFKETL